MPKRLHRIYELEILLEDIAPNIFRRFCVRSDVFLPEFHLIVQVVMGWENYHLHEFCKGSSRFGKPDPDFPELALENEAKVRISRLLQEPGDTIHYIYDFGDNWTHTISRAISTIIRTICSTDPARMTM